jgi:hypothetical protein
LYTKKARISICTLALNLVIVYNLDAYFSHSQRMIDMTKLFTKSHGFSREEAVFERRALMRKVRSLVRTGTDVGVVAAAYGMSRTNYYNWLNELVAWEKADPKAATAEWHAWADTMEAETIACYEASKSVKDCTLQLYKIASPEMMSGVQEIYEECDQRKAEGLDELLS